MVKLKTLIAQGVLTLKNTETPRLDADLLFSFLRKQNRLKTILQMEEEVSPGEEQDFRQLILRRSQGEPMAYIIGNKEFYGREFFVEKEVLIPRWDTEILVEQTVKYLKSQEKKSSFRGLEIGPGSGIISISLLLEQKDLRMTAIDINPQALALTHKNAMKHHVIDRLQLLLGDGFQPLQEKDFSGSFDFLVSNPPYISQKDMEELPIDIKNYEPHLALYGGQDGLDFYRMIAKQGQKYLSDSGYLSCEIGWDQDEAVRRIFHEEKYMDIQGFKDLSGKSRLVTAVKI